MALVVLATIAVVGALRYAADFVVPVVAGILLANALEPLVGAHGEGTRAAHGVVPAVQSALSKQLDEHGAALPKVEGRLGVAATLALFLLAAGDTSRRNVVRMEGGSLSQRRVTVEILDEIDLQVQRFLLVMLATNVAIAFVAHANLEARQKNTAEARRDAAKKKAEASTRLRRSVATTWRATRRTAASARPDGRERAEAAAVR